MSKPEEVSDTAVATWLAMLVRRSFCADTSVEELRETVLLSNRAMDVTTLPAFTLAITMREVGIDSRSAML